MTRLILRILSLTRLTCYWTCIFKPRSHIACDCDAIALRPKKWQSQRGLKGLREVLLKSPKCLRSVAGPNWSQAVFWACTKDWPQLIWSLRGFIGHLEVSKCLMLVADLSPTVRHSVTPRKGWGSSQCSRNLSVTDRRWGGDQSALYHRLVNDQLQSGF